MSDENQHSHKELKGLEIRVPMTIEEYEARQQVIEKSKAANKAWIDNHGTKAITFLDTAIPWDTTPERIKRLLDDFLLRHKEEYPLFCERLECEKFGNQYIFQIHRVFGLLGHVEVILANENRDNPKSIVRVQSYSCSGIAAEEIYWEAKRFFETLTDFLVNIYEPQSKSIVGIRAENISNENNLQGSKGGRPGLDEKTLVYRLAKAQEAEEERNRDGDKRWKEIAKDIHWVHGTTKAGVKLLEDARKRLVRLQASDPEGLLSKVAEYRRKEKKET